MSMQPAWLYWLYSIVLYPIIFIFPAYAANGAPVIFGGGKPLDLGKSIRGKRIFGDHKTARGTASSMVAGIAAGAIESIFLPYMLLASVMLAIGANIGDLLGSFIKRRVGMKPGKSLPIMDQYGFFIFALIMAYPLSYVHFPGIYGLLFLVILTGVLHVLTNRGAHKLKLKDVPW
ncbi:MAG: CDP-2,3-bis-(O-geranylgeranyl)-sn-glycerol synthase [Candidatus Micrarchaeia archaeon]